MVLAVVRVGVAVESKESLGNFGSAARSNFACIEPSKNGSALALILLVSKLVKMGRPLESGRGGDNC